MAKIVIPEGLSRKEMIDFLVANKSALKTQKKAFVKYGEAFSSNYVVTPEGKIAAKKAVGAAPEDPNAWPVKIVGNACWWCDSDKDVLVDNSAKKTIQQRKNMIPHLKDHIHQVDAQVGDATKVYLEQVNYADLGLKNMTGSTQCIIMESVVRKDYHPRVFDLYKAGKIRQHSIGLQYVQLELAVNDEEYEEEFIMWNKYYDRVINKEAIDEDGYFWVVLEIKLLEISCVLFGANELTPTLSSGKSHSEGSADKGNPDEPDEEHDFSLDDAIKSVTFFKN